jgi:nucleoside-diphosphate-sugar epimerase
VARLVAYLGSQLVKILITGAAGMIGRKLSERLAKEPCELLLHDVVSAGPGASSPTCPRPARRKSSSPRARTSSSTSRRSSRARPRPISRRATASTSTAHSACSRRSARSAEATAHGGVHFFDRGLRRAVSRGDRDEFLNAPLTSYGTQKAIDELLLSDYSRKGFFDGIGIRLPTICVRPGKPNKAASGFFSGIIREPLAGQEAVLPVPETVRHWFASPRAAMGFLVHAMKIDTTRLGARRNLSMPGISCTVGEQIEALRKVAGEKAAKLIRRQPDATIGRIVEGWPRNFDTQRALALGFRADSSFEEIIRIHLEDEKIQPEKIPAPR